MIKQLYAVEHIKTGERWAVADQYNGDNEREYLIFNKKGKFKIIGARTMVSQYEAKI